MDLLKHYGAKELGRLTYRKYISKRKRAERDARSFEVDVMRTIFKRMNDPKRRFVQW